MAAREITEADALTRLRNPGMSRTTTQVARQAAADPSRRRIAEIAAPPANLMIDPRMLDTVTGAPARVRQVVGSAQTPPDRLATLRRFYPDAIAYDGDNFVFFNPDTGRPTLYNPSGIDAGDIPSVQRDIAMMVGGGAGASLGAIAGPPGAVVGGGIGTGLGAAAADAYANIAYNPVDTRTTGQQVMQGGLDVLAGVGGEALGQAATGALRMAASGLRNRGSGLTGQETLAAYERQGIPPSSTGAVTGGATAQRLEQGLASYPPSAGPIYRAAEERLDAIRNRVTELGGQFRQPGTPPGRVAPANYQAGGEALRSGGQQFLREFDARSGQLYDAMDALLPQGAMPMTNTRASLTAPAAMFANAPDLGRALTNPKFAELADALDAAGGRLSWDQVKYWRSWVGRRLSNPVVYADIPRAELESVYAGLTRDMEAFAQQAGPDALAAFRRANDYYRTGLQRIDTALDDILRPNEAGESIYSSVRDLALSGRGSEDITKLWNIRTSMPEEAWDTYVSAVVNEMGAAKPGVATAGDEFSAQTFLTNWNKLSIPARNALFNGSRYAGLRESLDDLVRIMGAERNLDRFANRSNTAGASFISDAVMSVLGIGGAGVGAAFAAGPAGVAGAAAAALSPRMVAKLMTNPRFVRWLATAPQGTSPALLRRGAPARTMTDQAAGWLGRLVTVAELEPEISEEVYQLLEAARPAP